MKQHQQETNARLVREWQIFSTKVNSIGSIHNDSVVQSIFRRLGAAIHEFIFYFSCRCSRPYSGYASSGIGFALAMASASATPKAVLSKPQQMHLKLRIRLLEIEGWLSGTLVNLLSLVVHTFLNFIEILFLLRRTRRFSTFISLRACEWARCR